MSSLGRSFKAPAGFSSRPRRPAGPTRNLSSMSNSPDLSPISTPGSPALLSSNSQSTRSSQRYLRTSGTRSSPRSISIDETTKSTPPRSQPIPIELPTARRVNSGFSIAPLSARGDAPGGYFPLHEEQSRVYHHHPFQSDATRARMESVQRAFQDNSADHFAPFHYSIRGDVGPATTNLPPAATDRTMEMSQPERNYFRRSESVSSSNTPVASYIPLGDQNTRLPVGRYYPTNYENRKSKKGKDADDGPRSPEATTAKFAISDSQMPLVNHPSMHGYSRNESEAKRRLQQYQRDMVAQATIALNRGNVNQAAARSSIHSLGLSNLAGPSKPRLVPLGSPGPVTPMDLESSDGGYLGARGALASRAGSSCAGTPEGNPGRREGGTSSE